MVRMSDWGTAAARVFLYTAIGVGCFAVSPASLGASTDPVAFVKITSEQASALARSTRKSDIAGRRKLEAFVLSCLDLTAAGEAVTGHYWSSATPEQRERFENALRHHLARTYVDRYFKHDIGSLKVVRRLALNDGAEIIATSVSSPSLQRTYDVDWIVAGGPHAPKIADIYINGSSVRSTLRQRYLAILQTTEGSLDTLALALERHAAR